MRKKGHSGKHTRLKSGRSLAGPATMALKPGFNSQAEGKSATHTRLLMVMLSSCEQF